MYTYTYIYMHIPTALKARLGRQSRPPAAVCRPSVILHFVNLCPFAWGRP